MIQPTEAVPARREGSIGASMPLLGYGTDHPSIDDRWPADYLAIDGGRMLVRRDCLEALRAAGLESVEDVLESENVRVIRHVASRDNCQLELARPNGSRIRCYLKRHRERTAAGACLRLFGVKPFGSGPHEARGVGWCQDAGVATMSVIAAGGQPGPRPGEVESFFLSEAIRDGVPADDFWRAACDNEPALSPRRQALLAGLARTMRDLHRAHLFHRDLYWCHFFVRQEPGPAFAVHLIDLQRLHRSHLLAWRWRLKDLAQFRFSEPKNQLSPAEQAFWFRCYLGVNQLSWWHRLLWTLVGWRAGAYAWKGRAR